jgi:hypothetical protein
MSQGYHKTRNIRLASYLWTADISCWKCHCFHLYHALDRDDLFIAEKIGLVHEPAYPDEKVVKCGAIFKISRRASESFPEQRRVAIK